MAASGDLLNAWRRVKVAACVETSLDRRVELGQEIGNNIVDKVTGMPQVLARIATAELWQHVQEIVPEAEFQQVLALMIDGVRETSAYAQILGITDLPEAAQRKQVKQVKDRLKKRLQRADWEQWQVTSHDNEQTNYLAFAARKAAAHREYLACYLAQYQEQEELTEEAMMEFVGCSGEGYYRLALCQVPDTQGSDFAARLERVAAYAGASTVQVASVIRQVATLEALRVALQTDRQDKALEGGKEASTGHTAVDLAQETRQMIDAAKSDKKAAARRPPNMATLMAARDRGEEDIQEDSISEDEPKDKAEE